MVSRQELQIIPVQGIEPLNPPGIIQLAQAMQRTIAGVALFHRARSQDFQQASAQFLDGGRQSRSCRFHDGLLMAILAQ